MVAPSRCEMGLVENVAGVDALIDQVKRRAEKLRLAACQGKIAAIDAAIGRIDARMVIDELGVGRIQGSRRDHTGGDHKDGPGR